MRDSSGCLLTGYLDRERRLPDIQAWVKTWFCAIAVLAGLLGVACGSSDQKILPGPSAAGQLGNTGGSGTATGGSGTATGGGGGSVATSDCPTACDTQAACVAGKCTAPPDELTKSAACGDVRLALLGSQLFWTERQSGRVRAMAVTGGAVTEVAADQLTPNRISVDESGVYWAVAGDGSSGSSKVMKAALPLGAAPLALKTAPAADPVIGVAVDSGKVYYGLLHDVHAISTDPTDATDLIVGVAFARNDTREPDGVPEALTVHDGRVYWVISDVGSVESDDLLPGSDGTPRVGHSGGLWPNDLGFAGDYVYYAAHASLYAAQTNVPAIAVGSSVNDSDVAAFAVTDTDGYFADQGGGLSRHALALPAAPDFQPTPSVPLTRGQGKITSVVLDDAHVYWASVDEVTGDCAIRVLGL
jgi:hypothetical protein